MKKIYYLLLLPFIIFSCQTDEISSLEPISQKSEFQTLNKEDIAQLKKISKKDKESSNVIIEWEKLKQKNLKNKGAKITVVPVTTVHSNIQSEYLLLKKDGEILKTLLNIDYDDSYNSPYFSGVITLTDINGSFIDGYRIIDGIYVSRFKQIATKTECEESYNTSSDDFCNSSLDEIILTGTKSEPTPYIPITTIYPNDGGGTSDGYNYTGGSGGSGTISSPSETEEIAKIENKIYDPCARQIFYDLESGIYTSDPLKPEMQVLSDGLDLNFAEEIIKMFNDLKYIDYVITSSSGLRGNALTTTSAGQITTTLSSSYLNNSTQLSIARTIIHEMTHAYILYMDSASDSYRANITSYASQFGYNPYGNNTERNEFQHNFMGQYQNAMAYALKEWDMTYGGGYNLGWDYYYALTFTGHFKVDTAGNILSESTTFTTLVPDPAVRKKIIETVLKENNGDPDAKGDKCP